MTAQELIDELKKYPPDCKVGMRDMDSSDTEISAIVGKVEPFEPKHSSRPDYGKDVKVVILPK